LSLQRHEDDRRSRGEALIPSGKRIALRGLDDRRTNYAAHDFGFRGNQLLAQRFRVGVDVGPAPELCALDAEFSQAIAYPNLSFARDGEPERIRIVTITHFFVKTFAREFAKLRDAHGVLCFFASALRHLRAI